MDIIFQSGEFYGSEQGIFSTLLITIVGALIGAGTALLIFYKTTKHEKDKIKLKEREWNNSLFSYLKSTLTIYIKDIDEGVVRYEQSIISLEDENTNIYDIGNTSNFKFDQLDVINPKELQTLLLKNIDGKPEHVMELYRQIRDCQYSLKTLSEYVNNKVEGFESFIKEFSIRWTNRTIGLLLKLNKDNSRLKQDVMHSGDLPEIRYMNMFRQPAEEYKINKNISNYIKKIIKPMMETVDNVEIPITPEVMEYYEHFTGINSEYELHVLTRDQLIDIFKGSIEGLKKNKKKLVVVHKVLNDKRV